MWACRPVASITIRVDRLPRPRRLRPACSRTVTFERPPESSDLALPEVEEREAKKDLAAKRLMRYAGVDGTDWEGRPLDQREFEATKEALDHLHTFHRAQYENGHYRDDLMAIVNGLLSKTFPETEIAMTIGPKGRSWHAWRRTIGGWVLGIGAVGAPLDIWTWEGPEPPTRPPGPGTEWSHRGFDDEREES